MGRVRFLFDWSHEQDGDIRAGEQLWIEYDRSRFREPPELIRLRQQAAAAHFYLPSERWPIIVYARFYPDGQEKAFPMEIYGKSVEGGLNIPTGANKIELWFQYADPLLTVWAIPTGLVITRLVANAPNKCRH